jgi:membrane dipeptidase
MSCIADVCVLSLAGLAAICFCATGARGVEPQPPAGQAEPAEPPVVLTDAARTRHASCLLIDGHNDLPHEIRKKGESSFDVMDISKPQPDVQTDIPRLRAGGVGAQFWVAYVPTHQDTGLSPAAYCLEQIDLIHRMVNRYPDTFALARTADDVEHIHREGKIACLIGIEGGVAIENSLATLRMYGELGARYMTLTHSDTIDWCDSATDKPEHGGLTPFGEEVVREMNRIGMLVDISHVSADVMRDALRVSKAPIIASHSGAGGVADHPRNVPDDVLEQMRTNGGVVMVNFYSGYVHPEAARRRQHIFQIQRELEAKYPDKQDLERAKRRWMRENPIPRGTPRTIVDHIDHIVKVAGIDHVGIGGDYDGVNTLPEQLDDVSGYPYLTQALLDRGYSEDDIRKILGGNILRALREAERIARRLQSAEAPAAQDRP